VEFVLSNKQSFLLVNAKDRKKEVSRAAGIGSVFEKEKTSVNFSSLETDISPERRRSLVAPLSDTAAAATDDDAMVR
jgi:hypothetical protein